MSWASAAVRGSSHSTAENPDDQYFDDEVYFPSPGHRNTFGHHNVGDENSHRFYFKLRFSTPPRDDAQPPPSDSFAETARLHTPAPIRSRSESPQESNTNKLAPTLPQPAHTSATEVDEHVPQPSRVFRFDKSHTSQAVLINDDQGEDGGGVVREGISTDAVAEAHRPPRAPPQLTPVRAEIRLEVPATPQSRALPWVPIAELPAAASVQRRPCDRPTLPSDTIRDPQQHPPTLLPMDRREAIIERVYPAQLSSASPSEAEERARVREDFPPELMLWRARAGYPFANAQSPSSAIGAGQRQLASTLATSPRPSYHYSPSAAASPAAVTPQRAENDNVFLQERSALMHSLLESPASNRTLRLHEQFLRRAPGRRTLEGHALGLAAADEARRAAYAKVKLEEATDELLRAEPKSRREVHSDEVQEFVRIRQAFGTALIRLKSVELEGAFDTCHARVVRDEETARSSMMDSFSAGCAQIAMVLQHRADRLRAEMAEADARRGIAADEDAARETMHFAAAVAWLAAATSQVVRECAEQREEIASAESNDRAAQTRDFEVRLAQLSLQHSEATLRARLGVMQEADLSVVFLNEEKERSTLLRELENARLLAEMFALHHSQRVELTETRLATALLLLEEERDAALAELAARELRERYAVQRGDLERAEAAARAADVTAAEAEQWAALLDAEAVERDDAQDRETARVTAEMLDEHARQRRDLCETQLDAARAQIIHAEAEAFADLLHVELQARHETQRGDLERLEEVTRCKQVESCESLAWTELMAIEASARQEAADRQNARIRGEIGALHLSQRVELTETRLAAALLLLEEERDAALAELAARELRERHAVQRGDLERTEAAARAADVTAAEAEQWAALLDAEAVERDDAQDRENARLNKIHRHISVSHAMQRTTLVAREGQTRVDMFIVVETAAREKLLKTFEDELAELKWQTLQREQRKARVELAVAEEQARAAAVEIAEVEDLHAIESLMAQSGQRVIFSGAEAVARRVVADEETAARLRLIDDARRHKEDATTRQRQREAREAEEAALREMRARAQKSRPFIGMSLAEKVVDPKTRQSMAKLTAENLTQPRLVVDSLYVDGPAYREGLRLGDVIVSVGGVRSSSLEAVRASIIKNAIVGGRISIVVRRRVVATTSSPRTVGAGPADAASPSATSTATTNSAGTGEAMDAENSMRGNPLHLALDDDQIETSSVASGESTLSSASIAQETELFVPVLTIDPQFVALGDLFFDTKTHEKIEREPQAGSGLVIKRTKSTLNADDGRSGSSASMRTPVRSATSSQKGSPPSSLGSTATLDTRRLAKTVALLDGVEVEVSSGSSTFTSVPGSGGEATMAATIPRSAGAASHIGSSSSSLSPAPAGSAAALLGVPELATSGRRPSSTTSGATLATTPGRIVGGPRGALPGASPPASTTPKKLSSALSPATTSSTAKRPSPLVRK